MKTKKPKPTRESLERKILELESQLSFRYSFASSTIHKASTDKMMASGVLLRLEALGGAELICPVVIRDGLSNETIAAIKKDLTRSYEIATLLKPTP